MIKQWWMNVPSSTDEQVYEKLDKKEIKLDFGILDEISSTI